jgi:hypothetical protein
MGNTDLRLDRHSRHPLARRVGLGVGALLALYLVGRGIAEFFLIHYSDPASYASDWGGPSLAGVFAVHTRRERLLAARRLDRPVCEPMGRDERVELDGYAVQEPADVAQQLHDAAQLFASDLDRLSSPDWERTVTYLYPHRAERSLRWLAIHTVHEVRHHLQDVRRQLSGKPALSPAEREARWRLFVLFAIEAASEENARAVLGQALAALEPELSLSGDPVIRPRSRRVPDSIWIADLKPDLTRLQEIDPDDARTRCSYVTGHFPLYVTWLAPRNSWREAKREWPPEIWHHQPDSDEFLHPAVRAVMVYCVAADSSGRAV